MLTDLGTITSFGLKGKSLKSVKSRKIDSNLFFSPKVFGIPAMTNTAISRIAAKTGATVLPYFCRRMPGREPHYVATIGPPIPDFPSADPVKDVQRFVEILEAYIRECPEQYWWIHQRFKGRPESLPDIYSTQHTV